MASFERLIHKRPLDSAESPVKALATPPAQQGLATGPQLNKIVQDVLECIRSLKSTFEEDGNPVDDNNQTLHRFCAKLEYLLQTELKEKRTLTGRKKDYWDYFCDGLSSVKGMFDGIKYVKTTGDCKTSLGKGRAFLRFCLMHHRLADSLQQCVTNGKLTSNWYSTKSVWLQHEQSSSIISALYDLTDITFDLAPGGYDLDNAWPSFARKTHEGGQTWALSERARTMSISSLNSVSSESPYRTDISSTPIDTSGMDQLAQELAISENVRADLSERMEALEQQKSVFQQTWAESRGEVNMLELQLTQMKNEYKELQDVHRQLEKKYDKMCIESEYKQKDEKALESTYASKLTDLQAESDNLLKKISQLEEDLVLAEDNLAITNSEKESLESQLSELNSTVESVKQTVSKDKEEYGAKLAEVEEEKQILQDRLLNIESEGESRKHVEAKLEEEIQEKSMLIEQLEKKIAACVAGFQWLTQQKQGLDDLETADLDSSSSLALKDVSHFIQDLQEKIKDLSAAKENLVMENKQLNEKVAILIQESSTYKEKVANMETSISKLQEHEVSLIDKISKQEERFVDERNKSENLKSEIIEREKIITELNSKISINHDLRGKLEHDIEVKEKELIGVKEALSKQKAEIEKTNEFYNLATRGQSELMEKLAAQEHIIQSKTDKLMEVMEREKQYVEEKNDLKKDIQSLQSNLDDATKSKMALENKMKAFDDEKFKLEQELLSLKEESSSLLEHNKKMQEELLCVKQSLEEVQQSLSEERLNSEKARKALANAQTKANEQLMLITGEKDDLSKSLSTLQHQNSQQVKEIELQKEHLAEIKAAMTKSLENEKKLQEQVQQMEKVLNAKSLTEVALTKDIEIKNKECMVLEQERNDARTKLKEIQDQFYEKQSEALLLKEKLEQSSEEIRRTKEFYDSAAKTESDLSKRFQALENNLHDKDARITELTEKEKQLSVELSKTGRDKEEAEKNVAKLETQLEEACKLSAEKGNTVEDLRIKISDLSVEKEGYIKKCEDFDRKQTYLNEEVNKLKEELEETLLEKSDLEQSVKEVKNNEAKEAREVRRLEQSLFDMELKEKEMTTTIDQMKKQFDVEVKEKERLEEKVSDLEKQLLETSKNIDQLNGECEQVIKEKEELSAKCHEFEKNAADGKERYDKLKVDHEVISADKYELEEKVEALEKQIQHYSEVENDLNVKYEESLQEKNKLDEQLSERRNSEAELRSKIEQMRNDFDSFENKYASLKQVNDTLSLDIDKEREKVTVLQKENETMATTLTVTTQEKENLEKCLEEKSSECLLLHKSCDELKAENKKMLEDTTCVEKQCQELSDNITQLRKLLQDAKEEKELMNQKIAHQMSELQELQARFDDFQSENSCLVQEYDLLQQSFNDLKITEEVVRSKLSEMTASRDEGAARTSELEALLQVAEDNLAAAKAKYEKEQTTSTELQNNLAAMNSNNEDLQSQLCQLEKTMKSIQRQKENLETELDEVSKTLVTKDSQVNDLKAQLQDVCQSLSEKEILISGLEKDKQDIVVLNGELNINLKSLETSLSDKMTELESLNARGIEKENANKELNNKLQQNLQKLQKQQLEIDRIPFLEADLERVQKEVEQLMDKLNAKDNEIKALETQYEQQLLQLSNILESEKKETETLRGSLSENNKEAIEAKKIVNEMRQEHEDTVLELKITQDKNVEYETSLKHLENCVQQFQEKEKQLREAHSTKEKELDDIHHALKQITDEKLSFENKTAEKIAVMEKHETELRNEVKQLKAEKESVYEQVNQLSEHLTNINTLKAETETKIEEMKERIDTLENENSKLIQEELNDKDEISKYDQLNKELKTENDTLKGELDSLRNENVKVLQQCELSEKKHEEKSNSYENEISVCKEEIQELKQSVIEFAQLQGRMNDFNTEKEIAQKNVKELEDQLTCKSKEILSMQESLEQISKDHDMCTEKIQEMTSELTESMALNKTLSEKIDTCTDNIDQLTHVIEELNKEKQLSENNISKLNSTVEQLKQISEELEKDRDTLEKELDDTKKELQSKTDSVAEVEEALHKAEEELASTASENEKRLEDKTSEIESMKEEIEALEFQLSSLQLDSEKKQKSAAETKEFEELKEKVLDQETIIEQLQQEMTHLRSLSQLHRDTEMEMQKLKQKHDLKIKENDALNAALHKAQEDLRQEMNTSVTIKSALSEKTKTEELLRVREAEIEQLKEDTVQMKRKLVKLIREKDSLWQKTDQLAFQQKLQASEKWMDDGQVTHCLGCSTEFSFTLRKHHCRLCGRIFCHNCSSHYVYTAHSSKKSRACNQCFVLHNNALQASGQEVQSDLDPDTMEDIPQRQVLGKSSADTISSSLHSSVSSEPELSVLETTTPVSRKLVYSETPSLPQLPGEPDLLSQDVSLLGAASGNETDEDKLKDSSGGEVRGELSQPISDETGDHHGDQQDDCFHLVSDEEIQRSMTFSGDVEAPAPVDPNMTLSACINLEELERGEVNSQNEVTIKAGMSFAVPVRISQINTIFGWEFTSSPKDVVFSVIYRISEAVTFDDGQELVPPCKCNSHKEPVKGELTAKQPGVYTLVFNNTYSKWTSKRVSYTLLSGPMDSED